MGYISSLRFWTQLSAGENVIVSVEAFFGPRAQNLGPNPATAKGEDVSESDGSSFFDSLSAGPTTWSFI